MDQELKTAIENSNRLIETQRSAIEAKADAETVKRIEADLAKAIEEKATLEARLTDIETKAGRPGVFGKTEAVDEHKAAFLSFLRKSQDSGAKAALESKAANISIAGGAGIAVPSVIESAVLTQLVNENPLRGLARVISVSTPDYTEILDRANAGTAWVGETDTRGTTTAPDLAAIQPKFGTLHATVEVSQQALEDMAFNVESWLVSSLAERFGNAEGVAFVSGDGVNKPSGLLNGTVFGTVKSGAAANLGANPHDRIVDLLYGVKSGYRANGSFVMNSATLASLVKVKNANGDYIYTPAISADVSDTILGKRVATVEAMPDVAAGATPIAFGDLARAYLIADRVGISLIVDPFTKPGFVKFTASKRVGGTPRDDAALKLLRVEA